MYYEMSNSLPRSNLLYRLRAHYHRVFRCAEEDYVPIKVPLADAGIRIGGGSRSGAFGGVE